MSPDHKSKLAIILGLKPKVSDQKPAEEDDSGEGLRASMEDFLSAVEKKDVDGMVDAFKSATTCMPDDDEDSEQE